MTEAPIVCAKCGATRAAGAYCRVAVGNLALSGQRGG